MTNPDFLSKKQVIELISSVTDLSTRHIAERILKRPDAPQPVVTIGRAKLFSKAKVEKFLGMN